MGNGTSEKEKRPSLLTSVLLACAQGLTAEQQFAARYGGSGFGWWDMLQSLF